MIEESSLKSNFIGRDGFRWWIGQIPPMESMGEQFNGEGWGNRIKVRIMGYHPLDDSEAGLTNEDLPWALIMLGTADGSGGSNFSKSTKIRPGDVVFGFFMDGDDAQNPVIMGILGNTTEYTKGDYKFPFSPFTGYTTNIPKPDKEVSTANEANESNKTSQEPPVQLPKSNATQAGRSAAGGTSIGVKLTPANTCENTTLTNIEEALENLIKFIQEGQGKISEYQDKIEEVAEFIKASLSWLVGEIMKAITQFLVGDDNKPGIIPVALNALYASVYSAILPAGGPAAAHIAASKAIEAFVIPISALEAALICVANALLEGLVTLIRELLLSMLENIDRFVTCIVDQFVGSLLNSVVDRIADGLSAALGGLSGLLGGAIDIISVAKDAISFFNSLGGLLDCNQVNTKCDGTKEWIIGQGTKEAMDINESFENISNIVNTAGALANDVINTIEGVPTSIQELTGGITDVVDIFNGDSLIEGRTGDFGNCLTTYPTSCGSAQIKIFGGGGTGGSAIPILGPTVERIINDTSTGQNVNKTANVIGVVLENAGSGYRFPPFVEITDECGIGYGARARSTINNEGQITSIYLVSSGEKYPVNGEDGYGVVDVEIVSSGIGYQATDTIVDNFGNEYSFTIDTDSLTTDTDSLTTDSNVTGRIVFVSPINKVEVPDLVTIKINSETGLGAVFKPILGKIDNTTSQEEVIRVIDCIS